MESLSAAPDLSVLPCVPEAQWYAIQTRYRYEKAVTTQLQRKGLQVFLPLFEEVHRWSDRKQTILVPLFSGYTFAHLALSPRQRLELLRTEGVIGPVGFGGQSTPIPGKQIEDLQKLLSHKATCSLHAFLRVGQRVRVHGGCLDGLEGILEQTGSKRLLISIESIQRSVAVTVEGYELEPI